MINRPPYFVVNPRAGRGKCRRFADELSNVLPKSVRFLETHEDPPIRVRLLAEEISREENPILVGLGGDGTTAILAEAHLAAKERGFPSTVLPGGDGTAGDLRMELGAPNWRGDANRYAKSLMQFLSMAEPVERHARIIRH